MISNQLKMEMMIGICAHFDFNIKSLTMKGARQVHNAPNPARRK